MDKPFSQACENNKGPILEFLKVRLSSHRHLLEIGSGTGQHAVFMAPQLPDLIWQCSDMPGNHQGINAWIEEYPATNLKRPLSFTIGQDPWPAGDFDAVFTANTTHIMQVEEARLMLQMVADNLPLGGVFCQYGPFNIDGQYTSDSNQVFDQHLKAQGCGGIRDIQELKDWLEETDLIFMQRVQMPANNQLLVWQKG
ncbi:DUF938 domain-containing protein [Bowmanella dokdonensis]|uniref:DUF938 domain-containing protein n=1 Tax=Bowmanella dokdonensis TaxID=751969 RepID=A0A939DQR8_9ALTE|nr:DUF938 domain-containing protein [Bowmanella dokdonensis]MBN7827060.1 DUF938 domain-containing protein [Bowmanella dokdonensis]